MGEGPAHANICSEDPCWWWGWCRVAVSWEMSLKMWWGGGRITERYGCPDTSLFIMYSPSLLKNISWVYEKEKYIILVLWLFCLSALEKGRDGDLYWFTRSSVGRGQTEEALCEGRLSLLLCLFFRLSTWGDCRGSVDDFWAKTNHSLVGWEGEGHEF